VFTGLVETIGTLRSRTARGPGARLGIATSLAPLVLGESIAVSGACLTVQTIEPWGFSADASAETLARTTLGARAPGSRVNLERALPLGGRMGGHLVTGHVDGLARLASVTVVGEARELAFELDRALARYCAEKGSVAVDGISLTVNGASDAGFHVTIIPHTWQETTLSDLAVGDAVNVEVDLLARYVARLLAHDAAADPAARDASLVAKLRAGGFLGS
jgi:riboflavin synthase